VERGAEHYRTRSSLEFNISLWDMESFTVRGTARPDQSVLGVEPTIDRRMCDE